MDIKLFIYYVLNQSKMFTPNIESRTFDLEFPQTASANIAFIQLIKNNIKMRKKLAFLEPTRL